MNTIQVAAISPPCVQIANEEPRRKQRGIKTATPENLRIILSEASFGEYTPPRDLIPRDNILRMCTTLAGAKKSFDIRVYPDAPHGFLNDTMPGRFRAAQTEVAWSQITSFLKSVFTGEWKKDRVIWRFEADTSVDYDFTKIKRWE